MIVPADSYRGEMASPYTQNRYAYVGNNPINRWDPLGYWESLATSPSGTYHPDGTFTPNDPGDSGGGSSGGSGHHSGGGSSHHEPTALEKYLDNMNFINSKAGELPADEFKKIQSITHEMANSSGSVTERLMSLERYSAGIASKLRDSSRHVTSDEEVIIKDDIIPLMGIDRFEQLQEHGEIEDTETLNEVIETTANENTDWLSDVDYFERSFYSNESEINNSADSVTNITEVESQADQNKVVEYLKEQIRDTSQTIELTGLGTDMNPENDDDFLTMNVGKTTTTLYDLGAAGRATGQQSTLKVVDFELFNDFIQVDLGVDTQYLVAEGGAGAEINNLGFEAAGGGYATYFEGGIIPDVKIGKLGIKGRGYFLGGGDGAYLKGGINYNDSDGRKHLFNAEGVLEYFGGLKLNLDLYWE